MADGTERGIQFGSGRPVKASIWNEDTSAKVVDCLFNPTDYTFSKENSWSAAPARGDIPLPSFVSGGAMTLEVRLLFDTLTLATSGEEGPQDVRDYTDKVVNLMNIDPSTADATKNTPGRPPRVSFRWGRFWSFTSVITRVTQNFTLFWEDGKPIRAMLTVGFRQVETTGTFPPQNPTSQGQPQKIRAVGPGETIDGIAFAVYGDAARWRTIADYNRIENPLRLTVGQRLALPQLS